MKKIIYLIALFLITTILFAGCNDNNKPENQNGCAVRTRYFLFYSAVRGGLTFAPTKVSKNRRRDVRSATRNSSVF